MDKYKSIAELKKYEKNSGYNVRSRTGSSKNIILAPHGGSIEPGTSEIAEHIAGKEYSFYSFDGVKKNGNKDLHIASEKFDEESALQLVGMSDTAIAIHGASGNGQKIYIGGLESKLKDKLSTALEKAGFSVSKSIPMGLGGKSPNNICNKCKSNQGVQIELTHGLRKTMFKGLNRAGRKKKTCQFNKFVDTIQKVLNDT